MENTKLDLGNLFTRQNVLLAIAALLPAVLAVKPGLAMVVSLCVTLMIFALFFDDEYFALFGVFIFFYEQLVLPGGVAVYRVFTYLFFIKIIFKFKEIRIKPIFLPVIIMFVLYCILVLRSVMLKVAISTMADILFAYILSFMISKDKKLFYKLFVVIVITACSSGFYGIVGDHSMNYVADFRAGIRSTSVTRYLGSFVDPNYAGYFFNMAIFAVIVLNVFNNWKLKFILLIPLYYYLLSTGSMTALICNVVGLMIYIIFRFTRYSPFILGVLGIGVIMFYFIAVNVPAVSNIKVVGDVITRVNGQLNYIEDDNVGKLTSGRAKSWAFYLEYYNKQVLAKKLFGGNLVNTSYLDPYFLENMGIMPHEVYIEFLMNFGIVGLIIIVFAVIAKSLSYVFSYFKKRNDQLLMLIICSFFWIVYGLSIDYFPDWKFLFFMFF